MEGNEAHLAEYSKLLDELLRVAGKKTRYDPVRMGLSLIDGIEAVKREIGNINEFGRWSTNCFCSVWRKRCSPSCGFLYRAGSIFDHGRLYKKGGEYTYIGEPYKDAFFSKNSDESNELYRIKSLYPVRVEISTDRASWYPGRTVAIIFQKGELS